MSQLTQLARQTIHLDNIRRSNFYVSCLMMKYAKNQKATMRMIKLKWPNYLLHKRRKMRSSAILESAGIHSEGWTLNIESCSAVIVLYFFIFKLREDENFPKASFRDCALSENQRLCSSFLWRSLCPMTEPKLLELIAGLS